MGALPKFTGGAAELAEKLPGGNAMAMGIGAAEVFAIVLIFTPRTSIAGSAFAAVLMLGAIGSHVAGPVGMEGDMATMFVLAIVALVASATATMLGLKRKIASGHDAATASS